MPAPTVSQKQRDLDFDYHMNLLMSGANGGGITYADDTITSLSGVSQALVVANPLRKSLLFKNGAATVAINILGGTAAIGGVGCMTLQPYEGLALTGADCPVGGVNVIGSVAHYFNAFEGT